MKALSSTSLMTGFADPVLSGQRNFRVLLEGMSRPGRILPLPSLPEAPEPLYRTTAAICLTLLDLDTPLWLDEATSIDAIAAYVRFHCGCPLVSSASEASFALIAEGGKVPPLDSFALGDPLCPEQSTTLIIQVDSLHNRRGKRLRGPGIEKEILVSAPGLCNSSWLPVDSGGIAGHLPYGARRSLHASLPCLIRERGSRSHHFACFSGAQAQRIRSHHRRAGRAPALQGTGNRKTPSRPCSGVCEGMGCAAAGSPHEQQ